MKPKVVLLLTLPEIFSSLQHSYVLVTVLLHMLLPPKSCGKEPEQQLLEQYQMFFAHPCLIQEKQAWLLNHNFDICARRSNICQLQNIEMFTKHPDTLSDKGFLRKTMLSFKKLGTREIDKALRNLPFLVKQTH